MRLKYSLKLYKLFRAIAAIVAGSACKITWKSVENCLRYQRKMGKNHDKNAQRSVKTHCRQWVCGHCDCLGISLIFRLTTFNGSIRRQKSPNSANRVFYISLNKGYFGKAIFSRLFSARYHILKKKKKRYWAYVAVVLKITLSILVTCLVSSNCSVTHVRWWEGTSSVLFQWRPHFQRSGDVETVLFQCITLKTFGIPDQTSPNFQGSRRNGCEWCVQNYM